MSYTNSNWWELNYTGAFQVRTVSDRLIASCDDAEKAEEIANKGRSRIVYMWFHSTKHWPFRPQYVVFTKSRRTMRTAEEAGFFAKAK